jgi:transcriptional regulator with XRE-family HTH domain
VLRKRSGLTQFGLAEATGVSRATIAHLETGIVASARIDTLERLAKGLRTNLTAIISPHKPHSRGARRKGRAA